MSSLVEGRPSFPSSSVASGEHVGDCGLLAPPRWGSLEHKLPTTRKFMNVVKKLGSTPTSPDAKSLPEAQSPVLRRSQLPQAWVVPF